MEFLITPQRTEQGGSSSVPRDLIWEPEGGCFKCYGVWTGSWRVAEVPLSKAPRPLLGALRYAAASDISCMAIGPLSTSVYFGPVCVYMTKKITME